MKVIDAPFDRSDDVDDLLRAYFHAEMPHPWPTMPLKASTTAPKRDTPTDQRHSSRNSRLTLAASLASLLLGCLLLTNAFRERAQTAANVGDFTARPGVGFDQSPVPAPPRK